jgi:Tol biopolymer transport system component
MAWPLAARTASAERTHRASVSTSGGDPNGDSASARISGDGRSVVFASDASNLVPGDVGGHRDVFVAHLSTHRIERVSVSSSGTEANGDSMPNVLDVNGGPSISRSGRYVAFQSSATNLVSHDTNSSGDVFVRDLKTNRTVRASVNTAGVQANDSSLHPALSGNGRWVAFVSNATNLAGGDTNGTTDVFVRDLRTHKTTRVSVTGRGGQSDGPSLRPNLSADGRLVVFESLATNLAGHDANRAAAGLDRMDVFARDLRTRTTQRISVSSKGKSGSAGSFSGFAPSISRNRRWVVFDSGASNLVNGDTNRHTDPFLRDLKRGRTTRIRVTRSGAQANGDSGAPSISADGTRVAFESNATNIAPSDRNPSTDVFVRDLQTGTITHASGGMSHTEGSGISLHASIAADGRTVSFASTSTNLVAADANGFFDVFVRRLPSR